MQPDAELKLALTNGLDDAEVLATGWSDVLEKIPPAIFGLAGAMGLVIQGTSRGKRNPLEQRHRRALRILLLLTVMTGLVNLTERNEVVRALPDYLVLGFFCVTLYYNERLMFFDMVIKRGAFFALAVVGLTSFLTLARGARPVSGALLLAPFWLLAPWIYAGLSQAIDRVWLRRRYPAAEAERKFLADLQAAASEADLRERAISSLGQIFQAPVSIRFAAEPLAGRHAASGRPACSSDSATRSSCVTGEPLEEFQSGMLAKVGVEAGWVRVEPRPDYVPFLSDDRRLLESLARTLSAALEGARFREQEQQLRLLASRAELKALRAQINPHFLFNALNAIAGLIPEQPMLADETVEQLAEVFRYTLRKSDTEWVRFEEEISFVAAYLRVEQARFGDRLLVRFDIDPGAKAIPIPAMTIQPLVENAIKHGISGVEQNGVVEVRAKVRNSALCVEVFDNGPGFPEWFAAVDPSGGGHGLRNITERLKGYYGDSAALCWSRADGTRVCLQIPVNGGA
jgi:K+-sensing histidine kinase KdpD